MAGLLPSGHSYALPMPSSSGDRSKQFPAIEKKHGVPVQHWFDLLAEHGDAKYDEQMALLQEGHGFSRAHANAIVMTHRGSSTTRRFETPDDYFAGVDPVGARTARAIFTAIQKGVKGLELVTAWNQPMLRAEGGYVFGLNVGKNHITMGPWGDDVIAQFADELAGYKCGKKTFTVPLDWTVDAELVVDMATYRMAELT